MINGPLQVGCLCRLYLYCLFPLAFVFRFYLALLLLLYHFRVGVADGKVDGGKFLCFCRRGDFAVVGAPPVARAGRLVGAVLLHGYPGEREGGSCVRFQNLTENWTDLAKNLERKKLGCAEPVEPAFSNCAL